ncbi:hypothetical protein E0H46_31655 [Rhizobium leguminosarum bv. viciae]|nr:hypothetical protein E0H46_31655 [Rhizobium leguminosarum bv. viciae]
MPDTMIERVAKAIYTKNANRSNNPNILSWGQIPPSHRQFWCECAAAGIEEMRTPTEAMVEASAAIYGDNYLYRHRYSKDQWRAMVDSALNEEPPSTPHQISIATSIVEMTNAAIKEQHRMTANIDEMRDRLEDLKEQASRWSDDMAKSGDSYEYDRLLETLREIESLEADLAAIKEQEGEKG